MKPVLSAGSAFRSGEMFIRWADALAMRDRHPTIAGGVDRGGRI
jgi:hypothetical protein